MVCRCRQQVCLCAACLRVCVSACLRSRVFVFVAILAVVTSICASFCLLYTDERHVLIASSPEASLLDLHDSSRLIEHRIVRYSWCRCKRDSHGRLPLVLLSQDSFLQGSLNTLLFQPLDRADYEECLARNNSFFLALLPRSDPFIATFSTIR